MMFGRKSGLIFLALAATCSESQSNDWWQFRGPGANGIVQELKLPEVWGADSSIR